MSPHVWSPYQLAIFDAVAHSDDSLLIEAVAGSGKTSTIVEAINYVPRDRSVCLLAFNKAIAEELKRRVTAPNAKCLTLHAAGWAAWRTHLAWDAGQCKVDAGKMYEVIREELTWDERKDAPGTGRLVALAKMAGIVPSAVVTTEDGSHYTGLVEDTDEAWEDLIDHYGLDLDECDVMLARRVLAASTAAARECVDFDDMLYMPVIAGAAFERYDVVFVDEAQDVSGIQMEMVRRMVGYDAASAYEHAKAATMPGRVIAVGDRHQAIYGFRGAHANSMDRMKELFACRELPLSVTYRCPRRVVEHARQWVKHLEWAEGAEDGIVDVGVQEPTKEVDHADGGGEIPPASCGGVWELDAYRPGDAILCRINRPLVGMAFALIRRRIAAKVLGRDIGAGLVKLAQKLGKTVIASKRSKREITDVLAFESATERRFDANPESLKDKVIKSLAKSDEEGFREAFSRRLDNYRRKEAERLSRRRQDRATLASMNDRCDTLQVFVDQPDVEDLRRLVRSIEELFGDNGQLRECVTLATVHKAKGKEWDRVFVVDAARWMPGPWATGGWELEQEYNIMYVAATRAKRELRYVKSLEGERE